MRSRLLHWLPFAEDRLNAGLLLLPALVFLGAFYVLPMAQVVWLSFQNADFPFAHYARVFQDPVQLEVLGNTFGLAAGVAAITLVLGYPVAYLLVRSTERLRRRLLLLILASIWISIMVRTYAWMVLLGRRGPINELLQAAGLIGEPLSLLYNDFSVFVGMVHVMLPFMILPLYSVMQRIDPALVRSARSLGASPGFAFWLVFLPLSFPGVLAGTLLVFIVSIGFFITPALLGGIGNTTFVMLIEHELNRFLNWELAAAMSIVLLVVTLVLVAAYQGFLGQNDAGGRRHVSPVGRWMRPAIVGLIRRADERRIPGADRAVLRRSLSGATRILVLTMPWLVILFLLVPLAIIFPLSFSAAPFLEFPPEALSLQWYRVILSRADWTGPILTSVWVAIPVVVISTFLGVAAAVPLARAQFRFKGAVLAFLMSPMIVPVMVLAVAMHYFSSRVGLDGGIRALIIGHVVLALPFVLVVMNGALKSVDENLERTARTLGATPFVAFTRITLPLIRPAVLTSALFAFLVSFDELVMALFLTGPTTKTLPKRLWEAIREEIDPTTAAVAVLITVVCLLGFLLAETARSTAQSSRSAAGQGRVARDLRRRGLLR